MRLRHSVSSIGRRREGRCWKVSKNRYSYVSYCKRAEMNHLLEMMYSHHLADVLTLRILCTCSYPRALSTLWRALWNWELLRMRRNTDFGPQLRERRRQPTAEWPRTQTTTCTRMCAYSRYTFPRWTFRRAWYERGVTPVGFDRVGCICVWCE